MTHPLPSETIEYERYVDGLRVTTSVLLRALQGIVRFCDDPDGSNKPESLAMGLSRLLPAARVAIATNAASDASKTITIHIEGGLVQEVTGIPAGYELRVEDYDVQNPGDDSWDAEKECVVTVYEEGGS